MLLSNPLLVQIHLTKTGKNKANGDLQYENSDELLYKSVAVAVMNK